LISKGLMKVLERRGWNLDEVCLCFIGSEGGKAHVARQKKIVKDIVGKHGGIGIGKGPGGAVRPEEVRHPLHPRLPSHRGAIADVPDTAAPWSNWCRAAHAAWLEQDISAPGVDMIDGLTKLTPDSMPLSAPGSSNLTDSAMLQPPPAGT